MELSFKFLKNKNNAKQNKTEEKDWKIQKKKNLNINDESI